MLGFLVIAVGASGGLRRTPEQCKACSEIASYAHEIAANKSSMVHAIAQLDKLCNEHFNGTKGVLCLAMSTAAIELLPMVEKGIDSLAWDAHATCAALGACASPCCKTRTLPEQRHLSLSRLPSEMVVMWTTLESTDTHTVQWGSTPDKLSFSAGGSESSYGWFGWQGRLHTAKMSGLAPNATYFYRVGDVAGGFSKVEQFRTLASDIGGMTPLRIAWVADMGWGNNSKGTMARLTELATAGAIDLLIHPGDIGYADGNMEGWDVFLRQMEPIVSRIPYLVAPGNHEFWL